MTDELVVYGAISLFSVGIMQVSNLERHCGTKILPTALIAFLGAVIRIYSEFLLLVCSNISGIYKRFDTAGQF